MFLRLIVIAGRARGNLQTFFHGLAKLVNRELLQYLTEIKQSKNIARVNLTKVCGPKYVTLLDEAPVFEWYIVKACIKNGLGKTCYNEIGLCVEYIFSFEVH